MRRRFIAPLLAMLVLFTTATPMAAYQLAPSGRFEPAAISDGVLTICYGSATNRDSLYYYRGNLQMYLEATWGAYGLDFISNGVCNNDGSNIRVVWDHNMPCDDVLAYVWSWYGNWMDRQINVNSCRINAGQGDWTSNGPDGNWGQSTNDWQYSMQELITHEVGHTLGINHSDDIYSILAINPWCPTWGASQGLSRDDTNALRDEYDDGGYTFVHGVGFAPVVPMCWG